MKKLEKLITDSRNAHVFMKPNLEEDSSTRWVNKEVYDSLTIFNGTSLENITYKEDLKCNLVDDKLILYGMTYAEGKNPRPTLSVVINTNNLDQIRIHFILGKEQECFVLRFSKSCVRILFAKFVQSFDRAHALKFYKPIHKLVYSKPVIADIKFSVLAYIARP
jgi:hypothetical protein